VAPFSRALVVEQPQSTRVEGASIVMKSSGFPRFHMSDFRFSSLLKNPFLLQL